MVIKHIKGARKGPRFLNIFDPVRPGKSFRAYNVHVAWQLHNLPFTVLTNILQLYETANA